MKIKLFTTIAFFLLVGIILVIPVLAQDSFGDILGSKTDKTNPGQDKKNQVTMGSVDKVTGNKIYFEDKKTNAGSEMIYDYLTKVTGQDKKILRINQIKPKDKIAFISTDSAVLATDGAKLKKALKVYLKTALEATASKRRAISGVITDITGSTITISHQIQRDRINTVMFNSMTVVVIKGNPAATVVDLAVGQRIAAVGDLVETGGILAKRIHVIPGIASGIFKRLPVNTVTPIASASPSLTVTPTTTVSATPTPLATGSATPTVTPIITSSPSASPTP